VAEELSQMTLQTERVGFSLKHFLVKHLDEVSSRDAEVTVHEALLANV